MTDCRTETRYTHGMRPVMVARLLALGTGAGAQASQNAPKREYRFLPLFWNLAQFDSPGQHLVHRNAPNLAQALSCQPSAARVSDKTLFQCLGAQGWEFTGYVTAIDSDTKPFYFKRPLR